MPISSRTYYLKIKSESSYNAENPDTIKDVGLWNEVGAAGWRPVPVDVGSIVAFPSGAAEKVQNQIADGTRNLNSSAPVPGGFTNEGGWEQQSFPETLHMPLWGVLGNRNIVQTAGTAAASGDTFPSSGNTLSAAPTGDEQFTFTIASSTAATGASIDILVDAVVVETINITDNAGSVDGTYYSSGGYGATGTITFNLNGTVTAGTVTTAGISYNTTTFTEALTLPSFAFEEHGVPKAGALTNSAFYTGGVFGNLEFSWDNTAADSTLAVSTATSARLNGTPTPTTGFLRQTAQADGLRRDWSTYTHFMAAHLTVTRDSSPVNCEVGNATITIDSGAVQFRAASGDQDPCNKTDGGLNIAVSLGIFSNDETDWEALNNNTGAEWVFTFTSPLFVNQTTNYVIKFTVHDMYFLEIEDSDSDGNILSQYESVAVTGSGGTSLTVETVDRMPV